MRRNTHPRYLRFLKTVVKTAKSQVSRVFAPAMTRPNGRNHRNRHRVTSICPCYRGYGNTHRLDTATIPTNLAMGA